MGAPEIYFKAVKANLYDSNDPAWISLGEATNQVPRLGQVGCEKNGIRVFLSHKFNAWVLSNIEKGENFCKNRSQVAKSTEVGANFSVPENECTFTKEEKEYLTSFNRRIVKAHELFVHGQDHLVANPNICRDVPNGYLIASSVTLETIDLDDKHQVATATFLLITEATAYHTMAVYWVEEEKKNLTTQYNKVKDTNPKLAASLTRKIAFLEKSQAILYKIRDSYINGLTQINKLKPREEILGNESTISEKDHKIEAELDKIRKEHGLQPIANFKALPPEGKLDKPLYPPKPPANTPISTPKVRAK